jgi:hypothetical protein
MHERGLGVAADEAWAAHYRERACTLGFTQTCRKGTVAGNPPTTPSVPR